MYTTLLDEYAYLCKVNVNPNNNPLLIAKNSMLRKIRRWLAALCFGAVTLLFLDFTGTLQCRYCSRAGAAHLVGRPRVLFGDLSAGRDARYHLVGE